MHLRTLAVAHTLSACLALAASGCSFHGHAEYHSGTGGNSSAGAENEAEPRQRERAQREHHEGRHSPAGRDNVVRVNGGSNPAAEQGGGAEEPARTAVHPTGDVPPISGAGADSTASGGSSDSAAGSNSAGGDSAGADRGSAASESPNQAGSAPPGDAPATDAPSTGKTSRKSPSEPHVATPAQQKPRKVHRSGGSSSTNKEGGR
jgi:hypothetical protein